MDDRQGNLERMDSRGDDMTWFRYDRHPRLALAATMALAVIAALVLLFDGHPEPILYQGF